MHEDQLDMLGDVARIADPRPEVNVSHISALHKVSVDALEGTPATDDALNDVRCPGVVGDTVEVEADPEEDAHPQRVREATPAPHTDVDVVAREAAATSRLIAMCGVLEPDEVRLRLVDEDLDLPTA